MLYKYLPDNRLDVVKNLKIRFTQPISLNDPFEGLPLIEADIEKYQLLEGQDLELKELWDKTEQSDKTPEN